MARLGMAWLVLAWQAWQAGEYTRQDRSRFNLGHHKDEKGF